MFGTLLNEAAEEALALWKLRPFLEPKLRQLNLWDHFMGKIDTWFLHSLEMKILL